MQKNTESKNSNVDTAMGTSIISNPSLTWINLDDHNKMYDYHETMCILLEKLEFLNPAPSEGALKYHNSEIKIYLNSKWIVLKNA